MKLWRCAAGASSETRLASRLHLGDQRVADDEDHRSRGEAHRERQHRPAVVHEGRAEHAAQRLDNARELPVPKGAQRRDALAHQWQRHRQALREVLDADAEGEGDGAAEGGAAR